MYTIAIARIAKKDVVTLNDESKNTFDVCVNKSLSFVIRISNKPDANKDRSIFIITLDPLVSIV